MRTALWGRKQIFILFIIMAGVSLGVWGIALLSLYRSSIEQQRRRLVEMAKTQARMIEAMARFDVSRSAGDDSESALAVTLKEVRDAHAHFKGFGETGEFTLARREGDQIVYLLSHRHYDLDNPQSVPYSSKRAEPMRRALSGESGSVIGLDYRGQRVLAAYEPVRELKLGIVAKIDLAEVRTPFIKDGLLAGLASLSLLLLGNVLFARIGNPVVQRLEENERKYRGVFESAADKLLLIGRDGTVLDANPAACSGYGFSRDEFIGQSVQQIVHPDYRSVFDGASNDVVKGKTFFAESVHLRKDGTPFPAEVHLSPMEHEGQAATLAAVRDITERKRAEEAILRAKEEWELTFDAVPDLMAILDKQHRIVRLNKSMADRLGLTPEQCIGLHCHEAVHGLSRPPGFCPHSLTCQDAQEHVSEIHEPRLGGDFLVSTTPLFDGQDKLIGSIHVARDITERKKAEDQIKKSLREKEVLLKEIHHRVKNNLQIIHSMLNLQLPYIKDEQAIALFKESRNRVFSMALIHEKLYQSESLTKINLPDYIQKITANLFQSYGVSDRVAKPKIHIENVSLDLNTMIPCALILNELVSNSLKYAFPDASARADTKGEVRIELRRDIGDKLILIVGDNGVGLPPGFEIQKSKSLGLKLVSVLVKQLNGSIEIGTDGGAEFKITFEAAR